jgi:hypothetical protein
MEKEGLIAPRSESFWRVNPKETRPEPETTEVVMMKSHVERGLSLPPSDFMSEVMAFYAVNPQHLLPNAILTLSGFQALHEGYLGVRPTLELFQFYYMARRMPVELNITRTCGSMCFKIRPNRRYPEVPGHESVKDWTGTYFYCLDKAAPGKDFGIPPFVSGPAEPADSWDGPEDVSLTADSFLHKRRIEKLMDMGLTGVDLVFCWLTRRI